MNLLYPLNKKDGTAFTSQHELEEIIQAEHIGQYGFNPSNQCWHGGVHFTNKNAPWLKDDQPIQAIADGTVVACRINDCYQVSQFEGNDLKYSNDFCLIKHELANPKNKEDVFTFFSLYMHLAPLCDPHRHPTQYPRYKIENDRNVHPQASMEHSSSVLKKGSIIEETESTQSSATRSKNYQLKPFKVIRCDEDSFVGQVIWLATGQYSDDGELHDLFHGFAKPYSPPNWLMTKITVKTKVDDLRARGEPTIKQHQFYAGGQAFSIPKGTILTYDSLGECCEQMINGVPHLMAKCQFDASTPVVNKHGQKAKTAWVCVESQFVETIHATPLQLDTTHYFGDHSHLHIKAGTPIGYLGQFDVATLEGKPYFTTRFQIHFELLAASQPPQYFVDAFLGKPKDGNATPYHFLADDQCDGYLEKKNPSKFFISVLEGIKNEQSELKDTDIVENLTPWDSCKYIIARHQSEWAKASNDKPFLQTMLDKLVNKLDDKTARFQQLIEHEKKRIDNLIWIPSNPKTLGIGQETWNWWPVGSFLRHITRVNKYLGKVYCVYDGINYGPKIGGNITLKSLDETYWQEIGICKQEKQIILAVSANEGNLDSVQAYDNQLISAGAMQKTIDMNGQGQLTTQVAEFSEMFSEAYNELFKDKGWHIDRKEVYFSHPDYMGGQKLSGHGLLLSLRSNCKSVTHNKRISCLPVANLAFAISDHRFIKKQLKDLYDDLNEALSMTIFLKGQKLRVKDIFKTNLSRALVFDEHINRPNHIYTDIPRAMTEYFSKNPKIDEKIANWSYKERCQREVEIMKIYGPKRKMTSAVQRYRNIVKALT
ncbi:hypothetical protein M9194_21465 [Vibrio sp. S4M6]|uniref:hypothetical protein n=1 Tax=Vibrio sinus TaxID=2946865 RepID=UPI00202A4563|nr:hypothetical protein [Vibrio sinus]MCL9783992.1 hypothetical protein [Vibrio sinus]